MMTQYSTEKMIDDMVAAMYGDSVSARQEYLYRESLRALVRLTKSEQLREMRNDLRQLTNTSLPDLHHYDEAK